MSIDVDSSNVDRGIKNGKYQSLVCFCSFSIEKATYHIRLSSITTYHHRTKYDIKVNKINVDSLTSIAETSELHTPVLTTIFPRSISV